ncbi:hypothetical protein JVT61DRAFT_3460 [Boletus reticuloceps]|uniref:Uncharacterized protein n=1 Tax=Boletus reticuloceps TaxID=495285 RepID=A0A8I2YME9_9AGAM|nr:hypothetical protein JVT61DRAFT_3460 [Boletus reticuloceps]
MAHLSQLTWLALLLLTPPHTANSCTVSVSPTSTTSTHIELSHHNPQPILHFRPLHPRYFTRRPKPLASARACPYPTMKTTRLHGPPCHWPIRHHQTIMANCSGVLGMRITGRCASTSRRASQIANSSLAQPDPDIPQSPLPRIDPVATTNTYGIRPRWSSSPQSSNGVAGMEARRKLRMLARRSQTSVNPKHASDMNKYINPEISSSLLLP